MKLFGADPEPHTTGRPSRSEPRHITAEETQAAVRLRTLPLNNYTASAFSVKGNFTDIFRTTSIPISHASLC